MFFAVIAFTVFCSEAHAADSLAGVQIGAAIPSMLGWTAEADGSLSKDAQVGSVRGRVAVNLCENGRVSDVTFRSSDRDAFASLASWLASQGWSGARSTTSMSSQFGTEFTKADAKRTLVGTSSIASLSSADPGVCYR